MANFVPCKELALDNFGILMIYGRGLNNEDVNTYFSERVGKYKIAIKNCKVVGEGNYDVHLRDIKHVQQLFHSSIINSFNTNNDYQKTLLDEAVKQFEISNKVVPNVGNGTFALLKSLSKTFYTYETLNEIKYLLSRYCTDDGENITYGNPKTFAYHALKEDFFEIEDGDEDDTEANEIILHLKNIYDFLMRQINFRDWEAKIYLEKIIYNEKTFLNHFKYRSTLKFWVETLVEQYQLYIYYLHNYRVSSQENNKIRFRNNTFYCMIEIADILFSIRTELTGSIHINFEED